MADLIRGIDPALVRSNLDQVRARVGADVEILVATKYVADDELPALAEAEVRLVGENRLQDLERRRELHGDLFTWDFIGALQSRKVQALLPLVRLIHSVCTDSALAQLERHATAHTRVLVEVNVAGERSKAGVAPAELGGFIARCPVEVSGLMAMPPVAENPEASRPHFAALAALAAEHGLRELSMGTSQDWQVAAQEGATIIRLGSALLRGEMQA